MFRRRYLVLLLALPVFAAARLGRADDVRYYEENGITYCETKHVVQRPITETHYEDRQQTVYTQQAKTQLQTMQRTVQVPVTEYVTEAYWVNRYNPFATPYQTYRYVPRVRWEARVETVQVPVVQQNVVPQQQTVKVPITTQRMAQEQQITRVAVASRPATDPFAQNPPAVAERPAPFTTGASGATGFAGSAPLDSDPPRGPTAWRPIDPNAIQK